VSRNSAPATKHQNTVITTIRLTSSSGTLVSGYYKVLESTPGTTCTAVAPMMSDACIELQRFTETVEMYAWALSSGNGPNKNFHCLSEAPGDLSPESLGLNHMLTATLL
jgi:hypothetical protein